MATLKEFEEALRANGMANALAILEGLKTRDRDKRTAAPARRVAGNKMTAELAREVLRYHATTGMTQQEIAFKLGVNQGRVNEVVKRGKWLGTNPEAPELIDRDKAMDRLKQRARARRTVTVASPAEKKAARPPAPSASPSPLPKRTTVAALPGLTPRPRIVSAQLAFLDL